MDFQDDISGLESFLNRSPWIKEFSEELERAKRTNTTLSLLLLDFSRPDNLDKERESDFLKKIVSLITELTRYIDIRIHLNRKILIILPQTDYVGAQKVALRIKSGINDLSAGDFADLKIDCKLSVANFPESGDDKSVILYHLEKNLQDSL